jgi:hypothetical protein
MPPKDLFGANHFIEIMYRYITIIQGYNRRKKLNIVFTDTVQYRCVPAVQYEK